jgi:hypothetical protein
VMPGQGFQLDIFYVQRTYSYVPGRNRAKKGHILEIWDIKGTYFVNL